jgi:hypothetical protein
MRHRAVFACQLGDLGEAQLAVRITKQKRKDLALLLGAQDRRRR